MARQHINGTAVPTKYFTLIEIRNALTTVNFGMKEEVCMPESAGGGRGVL